MTMQSCINIISEAAEALYAVTILLKYYNYKKGVKIEVTRLG